LPDAETQNSKYQALNQSDLEADFQPIQGPHERRVNIRAQQTDNTGLKRVRCRLKQDWADKPYYKTNSTKRLPEFHTPPPGLINNRTTHI